MESINEWSEEENIALETIAKIAGELGTPKKLNWQAAISSLPLEAATVGNRPASALSKRWSKYIKIKEGLCARCGQPVVRGGTLCEVHRVENVKGAILHKKRLKAEGYFIPRVVRR